MIVWESGHYNVCHPNSQLLKDKKVNNLIDRDLKHIWHPCSQMKDYEQFQPLVIKSAQGCYIELDSGHQIIDAVSSWWCKSLGHGHPRIKAALLKQLDRFEHVLLANTCNETLVKLSEKLAALVPELDKGFYASEGSSAVEIALKMSLHARKNTGETQRKMFMALENGYHGETFMALAVSDLGLYRKAYEHVLPPVPFLRGIPYVNSTLDPVWNDCSAYWPAIESQLNQYAENLSAIIVEPIVQGAGGMRIYSQDFLKRLRHWTLKNGIHLIADEIMTGLGRTGYALACDYAEITPDFICLSKGLTAGFLPMSVVLTSTSLYNLFYGKGKEFLHSHTHCGNALAAAVALECLTVLEEENLYQIVRQNEIYFRQLMEEVADQTRRLKNIRNIGAIIAADLICDEKQRYGYKVFQQAIQEGALLRPLGNTIYWLPPLNIELKDLQLLKKITIRAIKGVFK